jgi:hypothetical protein
VTAYILCSRETEHAAIDLRATLVTAGWRVAELQTLSTLFLSRIVRPERVDSEAESELQHLSKLVDSHHARSPNSFQPPSIVFHAPTAGAPPDVVEVWLASPPRKKAS